MLLAKIVNWLRDLWCRFFWPREAISNIQLDVVTILAETRMMHEATTAKQNQTLERLDNMAAREDAAWEKQAADVAAVKEGWDALVASNSAKDQQISDLQAALEAAGGDVQAQIDAALDVDSEGDAAKVESANAALESLLAPPVEEPPVDNGGDNIPPLND
jgi:predicted nuclease with TOPRIM domain